MPLLSTFSALSARAFNSLNRNFYTFVQKVFASPGITNAEFGRYFSLSKNGLYAVVNNRISDLYIFIKSGGGWGQTQKIAGAGASSDINGVGDVIITNQGVIYTRSGSTWSLAQTLSLTYTSTLNSCAIDASGDYIAVSEWNNANSILSIWFRSGGTWSLQQSFNITQPYTLQNISFDNTGTYLVNSLVTQVDIYLRTSTTWALQQSVTSGSALGDRFGYSLSINGNGGNTLVVGRPSSPSTFGDAFIYTRAGTSWTLTQIIEASDKLAQDFFGGSVCIDDSGNHIFVGAPGDDGVIGINEGSAYHFLNKNTTTWNEVQKIESPDAAIQDDFGTSIDVSGDAFEFGATGTRDDNSGLTNVGALWFYSS